MLEVHKIFFFFSLEGSVHPSNLGDIVTAKLRAQNSQSERDLGFKSMLCHLKLGSEHII